MIFLAPPAIIAGQVHTEWYRSGYNGPDSKSGVPATVPWVRIPPTPPNNIHPHPGMDVVFCCGWDSKAGAPRQSKPCLHRLCRGDFRLVIQVGVDVRRGGEVAVAQPLLNVLEGNAVGQQQAGTAVPLRYNKDKRKNPVFSRVSAFVVAYSIPFPTLIVNEKSVE